MSTTYDSDVRARKAMAAIASTIYAGTTSYSRTITTTYIDGEPIATNTTYTVDYTIQPSLFDNTAEQCYTTTTGGNTAE